MLNIWYRLDHVVAFLVTLPSDEAVSFDFIKDVTLDVIDDVFGHFGVAPVLVCHIFLTRVAYYVIITLICCFFATVCVTKGILIASWYV